MPPPSPRSKRLKPLSLLLIILLAAALCGGLVWAFGPLPLDDAPRSALLTLLVR